ncbi:MAG TPA: sigma-70 family RNA polymerase sigma factor [Planctomicrobium sp.]|nr:sigma-70 family RNA polymerase sigma factor [Planctomicrobium sp.]
MSTLVALNLPMPGAVQNDEWLAGLKQHEPWLRKVLFNRVGDRDVVDDLMQEIGVAISRPELRPENIDRLGAWLYRVAVKQSFLYRRKMGRYRKHFGATDDPLTTAADQHQGDPLQWLLGREHQQAVRHCLTQLHETDRDILMLKYAENWTYQELADRLGVTVHTIEHRLLKAKKRLRQLLQQAHVEVGST